MLAIFRYRYETAGHSPIFWGFVLLIPLILAFVVWAGIAPLNSAAIANGEVVLNDHRKTVQHLEGGIVEEILVVEGQEIAQGAAMLVISDIKQRTRINTLYDQLATARALNSRLVAERDNRIIPDFLYLFEDIEISEKKKNKLITTQQNLFKVRQVSIKTKAELIEKKKIQVKKEIESLGFQHLSIHQQLLLVKKEYIGISKLYDKNYIPLSRKIELERVISELEGQGSALSANISQLEQNILASDIEIIDLKNDYLNAVLDELQTNELSIQELTHQLTALSDELERTVVKAPAHGRIIDLQIHTKGAVVSPGQRILDIVPVDDQLIVAAHLNPNDIDIVTTGTQAKILLSAYKAKKIPKLDGKVINVSGDVLVDEITGERYFLARVLVDESILHELKEDVELYPGMPTQVFFLAGERTVADYLLSPVIDATYRAFREE